MSTFSQILKPKMRKSALLLLFLAVLFEASAQGNYLQFKTERPYKWMFGIGWNVVDDDGHPYTNLFNVPGSWNYQYYPTMIHVDRYLKRGFSVEATGSFNLYSGSTTINGVPGLSGIFGALDIKGKYSFYNVVGASWFDPFIDLGIGATYRSAIPQTFAPSANVGVGFNFWVKNVGLRLYTTGKLGLASPIYRSPTNYLQHSVSILYRMQERDKKNTSSDKKRYKWTHKKEKFKSRSK